MVALLQNNSSSITIQDLNTGFKYSVINRDREIDGNLKRQVKTELCLLEECLY